MLFPSPASPVGKAERSKIKGKSNFMRSFFKRERKTVRLLIRWGGCTHDFLMFFFNTKNPEKVAIFVVFVCFRRKARVRRVGIVVIIAQLP